MMLSLLHHSVRIAAARWRAAIASMLALEIASFA